MKDIKGSRQEEEEEPQGTAPTIYHTVAPNFPVPLKLVLIV